MNTQTISFLFGAIFIGVGVLGFIPNPLVSGDGIFEVNAVHNLVHILTGAVFLIAAIKYPLIAGRILRIVGLVYIAVSIAGFATSGNMLIGIVQINDPDRWLHLALAAVILAAGFLLNEQNRSASAR